MVSHHQSTVARGRQQKILEAFADADEQVMTTKEIHEAVGGVTLETIRSDLKQMRGSELDGRETSQDYVWWVSRDSFVTQDGGRGVATGEEIRKAILSLLINRLDFRVLSVALFALALNSLLGVIIYFMLEFNLWLLPVSEAEAIIYTYVPMVTFGMVIAVSGAFLILRERL